MAKVLIAEDEPEVRKALVEIVRGGGHETDEAYDGLNALDKLKEFRPDVLLLDWMIPELHGGEVLEQIRNHEDYREFKDLAVVVVSDFGDDKSIAAFRQAGATAHVTKTDDAASLREPLLRRIDELLRKAD